MISFPPTRLSSLLLFFILLCNSPYSLGTEVQKDDRNNKITLSFDNADIRDLLRWSSKYITKNFIIHPSVSGTVSVISGESFREEDVPQLLSAILEVYGFALLETETSIKVIPIEKAAYSSFPIKNDLKNHLPEDVVVRLVKLSNVPADQVVNVIRPLMPKEAYINAYNEANILVLSDRAANILRTLKIIEQIDHAGLIDIQVVTLEYADAQQVLRSINDILPSSLKRKNEASLGATLSVDERSNSLLMIGDEVVLTQIRKLIERLDQPLDSQVVSSVIRLNYARASDLVAILKSIKGSVDHNAKDKSFDETDVQIEVDKPTNALIVTAPRALLKTMLNIISDLDVRRPQVLVEAVIVEVNDEIARELGIRWSTNTPSTNGMFVGVKASADTLSTGTAPTLGSGLTLGFYSSGELRGIVRALENDTASNVLSTPTVVALDNEEAEILVGENVPFITGSSTNSSSPTENPFQTIKRQDIGVTLKVKPQINNDDSITLDIEQTTESISPSAANTADIVTNKRSIKTTVLIEDDEVLVLGGLIRDEASEQSNKVPLLGDIPFLGRLFKSTTTQSTKKNLMAFIHPKILRERLDNNSETLQRYQEIRSLQQDFNQQSDRILLPQSAPLLSPTSQNDHSMSAHQ